MPNMKVCRVCVKESSILYNLFQLTALDAEGNEVPIHEMLSFCCSAKLQSDISLWICSSCSEECMRSYNFVKLFQKNDEIFRNLEMKVIERAKEVAIKIEIRNFSESSETTEECTENDDAEMIDPLLVSLNEIRQEEYDTTNEEQANELEETSVKEDTAKNVEDSRISAGKPFQCDICQNTFTCFSSVRRHVRRLHKKAYKAITCAACGEKFLSQNIFDDHYAQKHNNDFATQNEFLESKKQKKVNPKVNIKKKKSMTQFKRRKTENEAKTEENIEDIVLYRCPSCGENYFHRAQFVLHLNLNHHNEIIVCQDCDELFSKPNDYVEHYDEVHFKFCQICEITLQSRNGVLEHQRKHLIRPCYLTQQTTKCPLCKEQGKYQVIVAHLKRSHEGEVVCHICENKFNCVSTYLKHYNKEHRFKCDDCGSYANSRKQFQAHINTNFTGENKIEFLSVNKKEML